MAAAGIKPRTSKGRKPVSTGRRRLLMLQPMLVALLLLAGFQVYWIHDNFKREKVALDAKANLLFRDMMRNLQDSILGIRIKEATADTSLHLQRLRTDTGKGSIRVQAVATNGKLPDRIRLRSLPSSSEVPAVVNVVRMAAFADSSKGPIDTAFFFNRPERKGGSTDIRRIFIDSLRPEMIKSITINSRGDTTIRVKPRDRTTKEFRDATQPSPRSTFSTITFNDDDGKKIVISLDSVFNKKIPDTIIRSTFAQVLHREHIDVPFVLVTGADSAHHAGETLSGPDSAHHGREIFSGSDGLLQDHRVKLTETFSYLVRRISWPIAFSVFLVAVTLLSFILLYRSLVRQYRLSRIKNDLISNITHELKTPIATVTVAIEALRNFNAMNDARRTEEYLDISHQELQRLGLLVDKVLKLSMFENQRIELKKELLDLGALVHEVTGSLRLQFEKQHAVISYNFNGNLQLMGDRLHLLSVVFNLVDNALKYTKESPVISVSVSGVDDVVELRVTDNGIGIPAAYRDKVFDKFFRVPYGDTHNAKGHGLGLSYIAQVVQQHNGSVTVESREGEGSTFIIKLPVN